MNKKKKNLFSAMPSVVKKGTAAMLCCILSGLFLIAGCKKDEKKESYPIDIPFTEYSLPETCQWTSLGYDETVIVVNSMETLKQYISFPEGNAPEFDFSTNSLLLVSGGAERGISGISKKLQQLSDSRYQWDIEIFLDDPDYPEPWIIAITTSKPVIENAVALNVTTADVEDIPFKKYYLTSNSIEFCDSWNSLKYDDSVIVINNDTEFEKYANLDRCEGNIEIDFSKQTLLLASGTTTADVLEISKNLRKFSENKYVMDVKLRLNTTQDIKKWVAAIVTNKLNDNSNIELSVTTFENDWECDCADELFFYYQSEKVWFSHRFVDSHLIIWFKENTQIEEIINSINQTGLFETVDSSIIIRGKYQDEYHKDFNLWIFVKTKQRASCTRLKEIILQLNKIPIVSYADFIFHDKYTPLCQHDVYTNEYGLFISLRNINDSSYFCTLVQETNTTVCEYNPGSTNHYIIIDKNSTGNVLQLAQFFRETEKFLATPLGRTSPNVLH